MKYYIIAGEASGDLHASNLMKEMKLQDPSAEFRCWGGDLMEQQGAKLVKHYRNLAFMGFSEVIANLKTILSNIKLCKKDILDYKPDALILVDYPGFNLRIAEFAHIEGLRVFYYISPQIWAWKKSRVYKIRKFVDKMFVILPFEKDFYANYNYDVEFVGHPLLDMIAALPKNNSLDFKERNKLDDKPIVAVLPGSRMQEINKVLPIMLSIVTDFPDYHFVIAGAPSIDKSLYEPFLIEENLSIVYGQTHGLLQNAYAAIVTSGTATLETALFNVPEVVCYKGSFISYQIAIRVVDKAIIKFISLVNLVMDKEIVKELIQADLNTFNLKKEFELIAENKTNRQRMLSEYAELRQKLGGAGASKKTAESIFSILTKK